MSAGAACVVPHVDSGSLLLIGGGKGGVVVVVGVVVVSRVVEGGGGGGGGGGGVGGEVGGGGNDTGAEGRCHVLQSLQQAEAEKPPETSWWSSTSSAPWTPVLEELTLGMMRVEPGQQQQQEA